MTEETVMTIDYTEHYNNDLIKFMVDACYEDGIVRRTELIRIVKMIRDNLIAVITELQSTIAAQHDHIEDGARALEHANERITELELLVDALNENGNAQQEAMMRFQKKRIEELESQLSAALATIERSIDADNPGKLYAEGCNP